MRLISPFQRQRKKRSVVAFFFGRLREAAKNSSTNGRAIKEKRTFFYFFSSIFLPFKNENYFTLDNLSKYEHITFKYVGRYFYLVVTIFSKK